MRQTHRKNQRAHEAHGTSGVESVSASYLSGCVRMLWGRTLLEVSNLVHADVNDLWAPCIPVMLNVRGHQMLHGQSVPQSRGLGTLGFSALCTWS